jgi:hypothetical protein
MKKTSHTAALAASLVFSSIVAAGAADDCVYDDMPFETARTSEERLLGSDDEAVRYLARLPFTREIAVAAVVGETLSSSLAEARVPATVILEARKAWPAQSTSAARPARVTTSMCATASPSPSTARRSAPRS